MFYNATYKSSTNTHCAAMNMQDAVDPSNHNGPKSYKQVDCLDSSNIIDRAPMKYSILVFKIPRTVISNFRLTRAQGLEK